MTRAQCNGLTVVVEESHALPLVDVELTFRNGCALDPAQSEGLTRLAWRMVRMGTSTMQAHDVEEAVAQLGARLVIETAASYVRVHGVVIHKNLRPFMELLSTLLRQPAFRSEDLDHARREALAAIVAGRDHDRGLAARAFRSRLFGEHVYGRSAIGTESSLAMMTTDAVRARVERDLVRENVIFGVAGPIALEEAVALADTYLSFLPSGTAAVQDLPAPVQQKGRRIVVVDKPSRTQTQVFIGGLGVQLADPLYYPLLVSNTAFGGTFTSPLMQEVREKRGWSYGASSQLGGDRAREAFSLWTHPTAADAVACIDLQLELLESFVREGHDADEHEFAKKCLVNSHCFDIDTPSKRLEPQVDAELFGLPLEFYTGFVPRIEGIECHDCTAAVSARLSSEDLCIAVVATATDVADALAKLPGVVDVEVVAHDKL